MMMMMMMMRMTTMRIYSSWSAIMALVEILRERSHTRLVVKPALPAPANGSTVSTTFAHVRLDTFFKFTTECSLPNSLSLSHTHTHTHSLSRSTVESG
ncbi:hypothetical protein GBAR_LOCUS18031, partial [Geodia barretti]